MQKIKITEKQLHILSENYDEKGSVVLKKDTDPNTIKKLTDDGINVSMVDEDLNPTQDGQQAKPSKEQFLQQYFQGAEGVNEMETPSTGGGFSLETLKSINSFKGRVDYCQQHLVKLGSGTSRVVFNYQTNYVIKLAKNNKGLAQNEAEYRAGSDYFNILAKCLDHDDYADLILFVVMEKAKNITPKRWGELAGIDFKTFYDSGGGVSPHKFFDVLYDRFYDIGVDEPEFVYDLQEYCLGSNDVHMGDLFKLSSWGEVVRDGHAQLVIIDYGFTNKVLKMYFK